MRCVGLAAILLAMSAPAQATGGLLCRTAGPRPLEIALGFGHVAGSPLISSRLRDDGRSIPVAAPQWWVDEKEVRLHLTDPDALGTILTLTAAIKGRDYEGSVRYRGVRRWIRCREV